MWKLIQDGECDTCADFVIDSDLDLDPNSTFDLKVKRFLMDRSILKVHLPNGGFNMVKYGDATDVKVSQMTFMCLASCSLGLEDPWPRGKKTFFVLSSTEHEIYPAHKC